MRKFKKFVTVGLTAAMTTAMSLVAMASTDVTIHFKNAAKWDNVGIWIYEGVGWTRNVTPKDACPAYHESEDPKIGSHPIWPGAKMEAEKNYDGWYTITVPFDDTSAGAVMIFNNLVADTEADTTTGGDAEDQAILEASGLVMDTKAKQQSPNQIVTPNLFVNGTKEFWCDFDGDIKGSTGKLVSTKPASYKKKASTKVDGLEAVGLSAKEIKLTWTKYSGATKYKVFYLNSKTKKYTSVGASTKTNYTVKKVGGAAIKKGQLYTFKVSAYDKAGKKLATSSEVKGVALDIPTIKSVANSKKGQVAVKVNTVKGASGYIIYRSSKQKSGYVAIGSTTKTSYTDKTVKKGKTYYYKVAAYKTSGKAKVSTQYSAKDYKKIKVTK
ncbi:MAG: hypothetical protein HDT39_16750 [Lachnospiraceae bacterium]|nr:hypothetical protein [Lachnospiraceae bacterium]